MKVKIKFGQSKRNYEGVQFYINIIPYIFLKVFKYENKQWIVIQSGFLLWDCGIRIKIKNL